MKISVMGQGDTMGHQRRELLLPLCFAWLAGAKKGKETMNPMPEGAVCGKGGYLGRGMEGKAIPCVTAVRFRSASRGTRSSGSACLGKPGTPGLSSSGDEEQRLRV